MKTILLFLSSTLLVSGFSSCGKTTKGKLTNDWKVISEEITELYTGTDNGHNYVVKYSESTAESHFENTQSGQTFQSNSSGNIVVNELVIKKNGTWSKKLEVKSGTNTDIINASGTWSFINKSKKEGYDKHERILFNTLKSTHQNLQIAFSGEVLEQNQSQTYLTGEKTEIFVVKESSRSELELSSDGERTSQTEGNSNVDKSTRTHKMKLKKK